MPHDKQKLEPRPEVTEAMRRFDELARMSLAEPNEIQQFVDSVREGVEARSLKPPMRDKLLRQRWGKVPDDEKARFVSCWLQGDTPTANEAKSVVRFALDLVVDDPTAMSTIFLPRVAGWWMSLQYGKDATAEQKKRHDSYCRAVNGELQRFLERVAKLKDTVPPPPDRVAARPDTVRFVVDRITDAMVSLMTRARPLVRGADAKKVKATRKADAKGNARDEREEYLTAARYLLGVLMPDNAESDVSCDRLLGEIDGRVHERTAAHRRLTIARPPERSLSEELRYELAMVRKELEELRAQSKVTEDELREKISDLSEALESTQEALDANSTALDRVVTERGELIVSLAERDRELEAARAELREAVAQSRTHAERIKAEEIGALLAADLETIEEVAKRDDLNDVSRFLISAVRNIRQQLEAAGVPVGKSR